MLICALKQGKAVRTGEDGGNFEIGGRDWRELLLNGLSFLREASQKLDHQGAEVR